jgi:hypothetical protein
MSTVGRRVDVCVLVSKLIFSPFFLLFFFHRHQ